METDDPQDDNYFSIIPLGGTGVGKSRLCNVLLDGYNSGKFISSQSVNGGETRHIKCLTGNALGQYAQIKVFDIPGLGDPELPMKQWVEEINFKLKGRRVDMALVVLKSTDYRIEMAHIMAFKIIQNFLLDLNPKNVFVCFTHCDQSPPTEAFIKDKLKSFEKYAKQIVPQSNVVLFYGDQKGLKESLIDKFNKSQNMVFNPAVEEAILNLEKEIPQSIQAVKNDDNLEGKRLEQEFQLYAELIDVKCYIAEQMQKMKQNQSYNVSQSQFDYLTKRIEILEQENIHLKGLLKQQQNSFQFQQQQPYQYQINPYNYQMDPFQPIRQNFSQPFNQFPIQNNGGQQFPSDKKTQIPNINEEMRFEYNNQNHSLFNNPLMQNNEKEKYVMNQNQTPGQEFDGNSLRELLQQIKLQNDNISERLQSQQNIKSDSKCSIF